VQEITANAGVDDSRYWLAPDGIRLGYRRWTPVAAASPAGAVAGPPLVLLHGAASNWTRWWYLVEHSRTATQRLLLRPDLRGHGQSVWRGPARMEHWVEDLAALLHHEAQPRAVVVGHCLGANIAVHFAARHPTCCAGLVLIEPMLREALGGKLGWARAAAPVLNAGAAVVASLNRRGLYRRRLAEPDLRQLDRPVLLARQRSGGNGAVERALRAHGSFWQDVRVVPVAQLLANVVELARPLPVKAVRCPALVVQSSGGSMTDPALTRRVLGCLPEVEFREVHSQHWLPATHPEQLCELIDGWLERQRNF
jgi:esterase